MPRDAAALDLAPVNLMSSSKTKSNKTETLPHFSSSASAALANVMQMSKSLPLEDVTSDDATHVARVSARVSTATILVAAGVLEDNPDRFDSGFDAQAMRDGIAYEQAMAPLATALKQLYQRITRNIRTRRGGSATQTLAVYQNLKAFARLSKAEPTQVALKEMEKLLTTNRKRRATSVTQTEIAGRRKQMRKSKVAAAKAAEAADAVKVAADAAKEAGLDPSPSPQASPAQAPVVPAPAGQATPH